MKMKQKIENLHGLSFRTHPKVVTHKKSALYDHFEHPFAISQNRDQVDTFQNTHILIYLCLHKESLSKSQDFKKNQTPILRNSKRVFKLVVEC